MRTFRLLLVSFACVGPMLQLSGASSNLAVVAAKPVIVSDAQQFDFRSETNGREYRLFVATPPGFDSAKRYPVLYILDANYYFAAARDMMHYIGGLKSPSFAPAILVGVGYPTTSKESISLRFYDLTPTKSTGATLPPTGGGEEFIRLLLDEVKPFVASRFKVDSEQQAIFGKSLGGLTVLRIMLNHPTAFSSYIASSPSIQWGERAVLKDVGAFAERTKIGALNIRLLVTVGGAEEKAMMTNCADFVQTLTALNLKGVTVTHVTFPDENHNSVSLSSLNRAMVFGLLSPTNYKHQENSFRSEVQRNGSADGGR